MNTTGKMILVTGATGQQGGAVARHLLAGGWPLKALVRDPNKPAARALAEQGVELVQGDLYDRASLDRALKGVYGAFSVQNFWLPDVGVEGEVRQGVNLADAARAAGIRHFVYTSVGGAERNTGLKHFESKWQIEQHVRALGPPYTILRPVAFMDNYNWTRAQILNGVFPSWGVRPDKALQLIAADDIGAFVRLAFENPNDFLGKEVEIAGDELTEPQMVETLTRVIGRPVQVVAPSFPADAQPDPEQVRMLQFFNGAGYRADIPALREIYPRLRTFDQWLRWNGWENAEPVPMTEGGWDWGQSDEVDPEVVEYNRQYQ